MARNGVIQRNSTFYLLPENMENAVITELLHGESSRVKKVDNFPDIMLRCLFDWKQTYAIQNRRCHHIRMQQQHLQMLHSKLKRQISTSSVFIQNPAQ